METWQMILTFIGGGSFLAFLEFLIKRHDDKKGKNREILDAIGRLSDEVNQVKADADKRDAVLARTHILRFSDELYNDMHHSKEYFEQTLDDIKVYKRFCDGHEDFANGRTDMAAQFIKDEYIRLFKEHKLGGIAQ